MLPSMVSTARKAAQIAASVLFCFCIAGLVFGFAALKPILLASNVYAEQCPQGAPCKAQDTRLNFLFIVASSVTNVSALPLGSLLDRVGPRQATILGAVIFALGCGVMSLQIVRPYLDTYLVGYSLLALGSPAMFLAQFHLSNAFPTRSGLILGAITGAFDASSLPFVFYKLAFFGTGGHPSLRTFFLFYLAVPILLVLQQITFGPAEVYERPPNRPPIQPLIDPDTPSPQPRSRRMSSSFSRISYGVHDEADDEEVKAALEGKGGDGVVGVMFEKSVREQIGSSWFWVMEMMVLIQMTRINWYLATVNTQLIFYTGEATLADQLTDAFIFLLPLGGILSIPAIGWLLDTRPMLDVIAVIGIMGISFGALTMTSTIVPQLIGIAILVVLRPLFYTAISDYAAKVFGFETFGTVYGLAMTLSGLFGLILTPLDIFTKNQLRGNYTPVNITLLLFGLVTALGLGLRVWLYTREGGSGGGSGRVRLEGEDGDGLEGLISGISRISGAIREEEEEEA